MNKKTASIALTVLAICSPFVTAQDTEETRKQLRILGGIFNTVLQESSSTADFPRFNADPELIYLPGRGALFTFNGGIRMFDLASSFRGERFLIREPGVNVEIAVDNSDGSQPAFSPDMANSSVFITGAPRAAAGTITSGQIDNEAIARAQQAIVAQQAEIAEISAQIARTRVEQALAEQQQELRALQEQLNASSGEMNKLTRELTQVLSADREKAAAELKARAEAMASTVVTVLCDYGRTLRALDDDEFVSLIIDNFGDQQARIMLFEAVDVKNCSNADNLMQQAEVYDR